MTLVNPPGAHNHKHPLGLYAREKENLENEVTVFD